MTSFTDKYTENVNGLIKVATTMLKTASDGQATPADVIEVLDSVVDQLGELRQEIPGGSEQEQPEERQAPIPQEKQPEIPERGAKDSTEGKDSVAEQNAAQLALKNKTYSMNAKVADEIKSLQARLDEAEAYKAGKEREEIADQWSDNFPLAVQQARFDEVVNSTESLDTWRTRIETAKIFSEATIKQAKNNSVWIGQKVAKQQQSKTVRFI
jgi:hypothetical protein